MSDGYKFYYFVNIYFGYYALGGLYDYKKRSVWLEPIRIISFLGLQTVSSYPLIINPMFFKPTLIIACLDVFLFPFVAKHVLSRIASGPSDQEIYMKRLERLKYVKPKVEKEE